MPRNRRPNQIDQSHENHMINMAEKSGKKRRRIEADSDARKSYFEEILCNCARRYGYQSLKPEQKSAVIAFMEGNVFITLPTGFGSHYAIFVFLRCLMP